LEISAESCDYSGFSNSELLDICKRIDTYSSSANQKLLDFSKQFQERIDIYDETELISEVSIDCRNFIEYIEYERNRLKKQLGRPYRK
jgi:hypothetical protein